MSDNRKMRTVPHEQFIAWKQAALAEIKQSVGENSIGIHDADDVLNLALLKLWRLWVKSEEDREFNASYVRATARSIIRDLLRKRQPITCSIEVIGYAVTTENDDPAMRAIENLEPSRCIEEFLAILPERQREVLELLAVEQLSHSKAAELLAERHPGSKWDDKKVRTYKALAINTARRAVEDGRIKPEEFFFVFVALAVGVSSRAQAFSHSGATTPRSSGDVETSDDDHDERSPKLNELDEVREIVADFAERITNTSREDVQEALNLIMQLAQIVECAHRNLQHPETLCHYAVVLGNQAKLLRGCGNTAQALQLWQQCQSLFDEFLLRHPDHARVRADYVESLYTEWINRQQYDRSEHDNSWSLLERAHELISPDYMIKPETIERNALMRQLVALRALENGRHETALSELHSAERDLFASRRIGRHVDDGLMGDVLSSIATAYHDSGNPDQALTYAERSLSHWETVAESLHRTFQLGQMYRLKSSLTHGAESAALLDRAVEALREVSQQQPDVTRLLFEVLAERAHVAEETRRLHDAATDYAAAFAAFAVVATPDLFDTDDLEAAVHIGDKAFELFTEQEAFPDALMTAEERVKFWRWFSHDGELTHALMDKARALGKLDRKILQVECLDECIHICRQSQEPDIDDSHAMALEMQGPVLRDVGRPKEAAQRLLQAGEHWIQRAESSSSRSLLMRAGIVLWEAGDTAASTNDTEPASYCLEQAVQSLDRCTAVDVHHNVTLEQESIRLATLVQVHYRLGQLSWSEDRSRLSTASVQRIRCVADCSGRFIDLLQDAGVHPATNELFTGIVLPRLRSIKSLLDRDRDPCERSTTRTRTLSKLTLPSALLLLLAVLRFRSRTMKSARADNKRSAASRWLVAISIAIFVLFAVGVLVFWIT